jgi:hypothetical protein
MSFRYNFLPGVLTALFVAVSSLAAAETITYTYDNMQRLIRAQYTSGAVIEYAYDNMGNRLARNLSVSGVPANSAPNQAASPAPLDGATGIGGSLTLSWSGSDPNQGDQLSYFVHAGTSDNALQLIWSGSTTSFSPWGLQANTTYFWKVVTRDNHNLETSGPVWSFTTGNANINGLPVHLYVYVAGTGGGSVTSNPPGIACTGALTDTCSNDFPLGSPVTLMSVKDNTSKFGGWSIASCATDPNCTFTMEGDSIISATFDGVPPIRIIMTISIPGIPPMELPPIELENFSAAAPMLSVMSFPMVMQSTNRIFTEDIDFNSGTQEVLWKGGYAGDFLSQTGASDLQGILTISGGTLIMERIVIR